MTTTRSHSMPALLDALSPVVRPAMLEEFTGNCSIATCRVLRRVFARFGYDAVPMPCAVYIYNAAMMKLFDNGMRIPEDMKERRRFLDLIGAWGVGIVPESARISETPGFGGHVVLSVERMLIDASLQQVNRPDKNLMLPAFLAFEPTPRFLGEPRGQEIAVTLNSGDAITYKRITDYSFRTAGDWLRDGQPYSDVLKKIVRETRERLDSGREQAGASNYSSPEPG
jgi:hypothetical protein